MLLLKRFSTEAPKCNHFLGSEWVEVGTFPYILGVGAELEKWP